MSKPDLGVRCSTGPPEEWRQALATLEDGPVQACGRPHRAHHHT